MSKIIFDAHACRQLADGVLVLRADTRVDCASESYQMVALVGWVMGVCWVFGVPCYWLVSLMKNKEAIQSTGNGGQATIAAQRYHFLVGAYKLDTGLSCFREGQRTEV